jgi:hypothetical protein
MMAQVEETNAYRILGGNLVKWTLVSSRKEWYNKSVGYT